MDEPEPLIIEYSMVQWMNSSYVGRDLDKKCQPDRLRDRYRGLIRRVQGTAVGVSDDDTENND
jgi:putative DNA primase/helicase